MKFGLLAMVLVLLNGCVSLNSVSLTSVPADRSKRVAAASERFIFMGFNFDNDYVNSITSDLKTQCPNGTVSGVLTKSESINYFLYIFWKSRVSASGFCLPGKMASANELNRKRKPTDVGGEESGVESEAAAVQ
tara:strand:+ start:71750 stop:72151 length:402 start_codon:yes stop_codon:yes gene_type:complete